jgi:ketosteroid isomerase-like protein
MATTGSEVAEQEAHDAGPATVEDEVNRAEQRRFTALVDGDIDAFEDLCDDRFTYTHSTGHRDSKSSFSAACRGGLIRYHRIGATAEQIALAGECAVVTGTMEADLSVNGTQRTVRNLSTSVWVRETGTWKLLASHLTAVRA